MKGLYTLVSFHAEWRELVKTLPHGEPVTLIRENHPKDASDVQVWARGSMIGYVKAAQNRPLAMAMDAKAEWSSQAGSPLGFARLAVPPGKWPLVEVTEVGESGNRNDG